MIEKGLAGLSDIIHEFESLGSRIATLKRGHVQRRRFFPDVFKEQDAVKLSASLSKINVEVRMNRVKQA